MRTRVALIALLSFLVASLALAQVPSVQLPEPAMDALINSTFKFCVVFSNSGNAAGYAPFIDVVVPRDPMNGNAPGDGIRILSATLKSTNPTVSLVMLPSAYATSAMTVPHPLAPEVTPVSLAAGQQLVTFPLPFGSFQPSQPAAMVEVTAEVDKNANVAQPLTIYVRGGFRYGASAGSGTGVAIVVPAGVPATWQPETITPRIVILHDAYSGAEHETVPGPNFPQTFTVTADVAPGQILSSLTLKQCLTAGGVWQATPSSVPPASSGNTAGSCFTLTYNSLTGMGAGTIVVTRPSTVDSTLLGTAKCASTMSNTASLAAGTWQPLDTGDPLVQLAGMTQSPPSTDVDVKALAVQKKAQMGSTIPGSIITYAVDFQISDDQSFGNLAIADTMSDGLSFVSASLTVTDKNGTKTLLTFPGKYISKALAVDGSFQCPPPDNSLCMPPGAIPSGPVTLQSIRRVFNISGALQSAGYSGVLMGGNLAPVSNIGAHGTLTIRLQVLDTFLFGNHNGLGQDDKVDKDDPLLNRADISGQVPGGGLSCSDDGNSCLAVPTAIHRKETVAVNRNYLTSYTTLGGPNVSVGDEITFLQTTSLPTGDAEVFTVHDWTPLPPLILSSTLTMAPCSIDPPNLIPQPDCYVSQFPIQSTSIAPGSDNSYLFDFGTFDDTVNVPRDVKIYTTHKVSNLPFPDGLQLTNESQQCEKNSYGTQFCQAAIAQFTLDEPYLRIRKGVCGGSCQGGNTQSFCPACPNPGTFDSTTVANLLGASSIYADANDHVQFAVAVDNTGHHAAYDIRIKDALQGGFPGSINYPNFCVVDGSGNAVPFTWVTQQPGTFTIALTNPLPPVTAPNGTNAILILYDVQLWGSKKITNGCFDNRGHIEHYANEVGGPDFVAAGFAGADASARICIQPHDLKKTAVLSSEADPGLFKAAIGNIITYELSWIEPEGLSSFTVDDQLPPGFWMVGSAATVSGIGFTPNVTSALNSGTPNHLLFALSIFNPKNDPVCERVVLRIPVQAMNHAVNTNGTTKPNSFKIGNLTSNIVNITVVEPKLAATKNVTQIPGTGILQYDINIANSSPATAFDIAVKESIPLCVNLPNTTPTVVVPAGVTWSGVLPNLTISALEPGQSASIKFQATIKCEDCSKLTNSVRVQWTSEPGPQGTANATSGGSCASNGERCGNGGGMNQYYFVANASFCAKVCGMKYADLNGNGVRDPNEPPLAGWPVSSGGMASTTTDASGNYCLLVWPGQRPICEGTLPTWTPTQPAAAPPCVTVNVPVNGSATVNFGNKPQCYARLCGRKTTPGPNPQPVAGWTITATPIGGGPVVTATTDANGDYCMILYGNGAYDITEEAKTGWLQSAPPTGKYQIKVTCGAAGPVITGVDPLHADFVNQNVCLNTKCPLGYHCVVGTNNAPQCVKDIIDK